MEHQVIIGVLMLCMFTWQAHAAVNCTTAGRFADPNDTTCQNYTLCVYSSSTGSYIAYDYVCPTTSVFNPTTSQCTASGNYVCNVTTTTANSSVCTANGYIANSNSSDCSSYIECVDINGTYIETTYDCPNGTFFNPNTTLCEADYNCTTFTTSSFNCTTAGRFADTSDLTCQNYFYCVLLSSGSYVQYNYTCPATSVFSPVTRVCTTSYTCTI